MSVLRILAPLASLAVSSQALAKDFSCRELDYFVSGQLAEKDLPVPLHWAEIHFGVADDPFATWSMGCLHSEDLASKRFCDWALQNVGGEFGDNNLKRLVLDCMGYRMPARGVAHWGVTEGYFQRKVRTDIWLTMKVTRAGLSAMESAIRLTFEFSKSPTTPPDLGPILPFADGGRRREANDR